MFYILSNLLLLLSGISYGYGQNYRLSNAESICIVQGCACMPISSKYIVSCNFSTNDFAVNANSLPSKVCEFEITYGGRVTFEADSFSNLNLLQKVVVKNVTSLSLLSSSFSNSSQTPLRLEIDGVNRVEIESKSFYKLRGPITLLVNDCDALMIHSNAISWIVEVRLTNAREVKFGENAFSQMVANTTDSSQTRTSKISMTKISTQDLPTNVFPSSTTEIRLQHCHVKTVRRNAFMSMEVDVKIEDSTFEVMESEAFSDKSILKQLYLKNVTVNQIQTGAILSAVAKLTLSDSIIHIIEEEAFNIPLVIEVLFTNNVFHDVKERGITMRGWKQIYIENNTLHKLDQESINVPYDSNYHQQVEFRFASNILEFLESRALVFNIASHTTLNVNENIFIRRCQCNFRTHFAQFIASDEYVIDLLLNESYCILSSTFAKCFSQPEGFTKISFFTRYACSAEKIIECRETDTTTAGNPNIIKAVDILNERKLSQEHTVIVAAIIVAAIGTLIVVSFTICLWFGHKMRFEDECRLSSVSSVLSSLFLRFSSSGQMVRATSTGSITRVSIHEYAEVRPHKIVDVDEETYVCEDKATQTLPEEMTQELLQTLREKLNDPENCDEARNMIEHLYDLIKVEECCNKNILNDQMAELNFDNYATTTENIYDVIQPTKMQRVRRCDRTSKTLATKGTRAPSPDKLSPLKFTTLSFNGSTQAPDNSAEPPVTEYTEPSDRRSNIYSEPLYYRHRPSSPNRDAHTIRPRTGVTILADYKNPHDAKIPVYSELVDMIDRPLPNTPILPYHVHQDLGEIVGTRL